MSNLNYRSKTNFFCTAEIPFMPKPFPELTDEEAEAYFAEFLGVTDGRVQYLEAVSETVLDYSPGSLAELWRWFLAVAETEEVPPPKKKKRGWWQKKKEEPPAEPPKNGGLCFTTETELALWDITVYFGEVLIRNLPLVAWGYRREGFCANMPVITGFSDRDYDPPEKDFVEPFPLLRKEADKIFAGTQDEDDLYRLFRALERIAP